ncbi:MAG: S8 family serine peptidase [Mycobacteriales bacterium]
MPAPTRGPIPGNTSPVAGTLGLPRLGQTGLVNIGLAADIAADIARQRKTNTVAPHTAAGSTPVSPSQCTALYGSPCYGPTQLRTAYGLPTLPGATTDRRRVDGAGATIAILISYGHPHIQGDLDRFSDQFGLPRAPVETLTYGTVPPYDPTDPNQLIAAAETDLDVQYAHAMAPAAHLIVMATGSFQSAGTGGMGDLMAAMTWLAGHRHVDVISMSWGSFEQQFPEQAGKPGDYRLLKPLRAGLAAAARRRITLVAADGDTGPTGPNLAGTALYATPTVAWPASDPLVTAVGGTELHLDDTGHRTNADTLWTDTGFGVATGGGRSAVFDRPSYQDRVRAAAGDTRALADITMDGSVNSRVWVYFGAGNPYDPTGTPGWGRAAGTSVSAPLFAGIVADAAGLAGHPLGTINPTLYRLHTGSGLADVTQGCNTADGVTGFCATPGYDVVSGMGTVGDARRLIPALAHGR